MKGRLLLLTICLPVAVNAVDFRKPVRLEAGGEIIETEVGHSAPFVGDFDGDGRRDLLVGQFGGGKLWIFPVIHEGDPPVLGKGRLFREGKPDGTVPAG